MIHTSYYAKYRGMDGVSIARYSPKWFKGGRDIELAPSAQLLLDYKHGHINDAIYSTYYRTQLDKLDPAKVYERLDGKVLLCYEKSTSFCHRHLVATWLRENGYEVQEL